MDLNLKPPMRKEKRKPGETGTKYDDVNKTTKDNKAIMDKHNNAMLNKLNLVKHNKYYSKPKYHVNCIKGVKKTIKKS